MDGTAIALTPCARRRIDCISRHLHADAIASHPCAATCSSSSSIPQPNIISPITVPDFYEKKPYFALPHIRAFLDNLFKDQSLTLQPRPEHPRHYVLSDITHERHDSVYFIDKQRERLFGCCYFGPKAEGYPSRTHGGAIATALDGIQGLLVDRLFCTPTVAAVTKYLNTTYNSFIPLNSSVGVSAWIEKREGRKLFCKAILFSIPSSSSSASSSPENNSSKDESYPDGVLPPGSNVHCIGQSLFILFEGFVSSEPFLPN